ncbi:hypothetical protein HOLleu_28947 [Holothuria leucospilota]|uniref:C2H2-type domain-containing protein n=1 Tax=Holothuria leucospilota TaxID=206669 RepID=A0A9Q1BMT3_HOLLE|nr:hypothetical protein HOLleu_28947 [Holothuria leucospilota]
MSGNGVTPGDINLEDATDDVEEGEEMQFADVDSEDTDSVCSDNSEDGDEMEEDEVEHRETSVFDKSPFGIKSMSQITRVGSCTTSMSAISDSGLSSSLMALHQRMGLRRSLSEVHLASQSEKESKEKDPAREQRLDELMGKRQKPHKSESELSKTSHDPTRLSLPGIPEEGNNAIKHLLLTRHLFGHFPWRAYQNLRTVLASFHITINVKCFPSPTLMVPFSPVSGRPPLVSPMSPSKLSQLPATVLSRVHSPSPLARNSLHFRLDPSSKAEMQPPLSDKKESTLGHIESSSAEVLQSDKSLSADDTPHTAATSSSANGEVSPEDEQALPSPSNSGPHRCSTCGKGFMKPNQLRIHCRDHTMEQYYTCFDCCLHFPTKFLLSKHERTEQHFAKVEAVEIATVGSDPEPRPFKCKECSIAFRIPGHLAKHLRSRGHLMTLERSGKLPPHKEQLLRAELGSEDKDDNYAASPESSERTDSAKKVIHLWHLFEVD